MAKFKLSKAFEKAVRKAWDKGSAVVLELTWREASKRALYDETSPEERGDVMGELGIIVGEARAAGPDEFFKRFTAWANKEAAAIQAVSDEAIRGEDESFVDDGDDEEDGGDDDLADEGDLDIADEEE